MSVHGTRATAVREAIADICADPPIPPELIEAVADRVRTVVPYDNGAWMVTDPETMLPTEIWSIQSSPELHDAYSSRELDPETDFNSFHDMLRSGRTVAALGLSTDGKFELSRRYREVHVPFGLRDELRLLARSASSTWAIACLSRASDVPNFDSDELAYVATIADHLGDGLRRSYSRHAGPGDEPRAPGMLVVSADGAIEASTGEADRWLAYMTAPFPGALPTPIAMVAAQAQANATHPDPVRAARLRLQVPGGGWLLVHADVLKEAGAAAARVAVVLEPADRAALVPLLLALHGLTGRERQVAELLVTGLSTDEIAQRLSISKHTLRDHIKAIFAKVGVGSRPELTAALAQEPLAA
ncbi:MAG TPA: helix-turn-helix transcriptional regulator [Solirubrobacteraceae bacterium]